MMEIGSQATKEIGRNYGRTAAGAARPLTIILAGLDVLVSFLTVSNKGKYIPEYRQRRKKPLQRRPKQCMHRSEASILSM